MNKIKRLTALLLVICSLFSLAACEEYEQGGGGGILGGIFGDGGGSGGGGDGELNDDPTDDFTVTLTADGQPYKPRMEMQAYWNDGFSIHTATFDENGVARVDGLDGDYRVTLSAVPNEYTYDPNSHIATNDKRNITVELYTLNRLTGGGTGIYDCYHFSKTGVYSAVIDGPDDAIYFQYAPDASGTYSIESWMDITADSVNPYVDVYGGSSQFKYFIKHFRQQHGVAEPIHVVYIKLFPVYFHLPYTQVEADTEPDPVRHILFYFFKTLRDFPFCFLLLS